MYVQCLAPYKQEVGGSSPSLPTKHCAARNAFRSLSSVVNCYSQRLTGSRRILPRRAAGSVYTGLSKLSDLNLRVFLFTRTKDLASKVAVEIRYAGLITKKFQKYSKERSCQR